MQIYWHLKFWNFKIVVFVAWQPYWSSSFGSSEMLSMSFWWISFFHENNIIGLAFTSFRARMTDGPRSENVQVVVRIRPLNATEKSAGHKNVIRVDSVNNAVTICGNQMEKSASGSNSYNEMDRSFTFDSVFGPESSQVHISSGPNVHLTAQFSNPICLSDGSLQSSCQADCPECFAGL